MCFGAEDGRVALCDFQYIGKACCTKDLAYLLVCGTGSLACQGLAPSQHESDPVQLG
jgi:hypothetical protein